MDAAKLRSRKIDWCLVSQYVFGGAIILLALAVVWLALSANRIRY